MAEPQWPPKSPAQALLSSPSGRKKYREFMRQRQTSPSPTKRSRIPGGTNGRLDNGEENGEGMGEEQEEEEDEETLQLQLQAIQAKLKLKKLQSKKARAPGAAAADDEIEHENDLCHSYNDGSSALGISSLPGSRAGSALEGRRLGAGLAVGDGRDPAAKAILRSRSAVDLQVPLSPVKRRPIPQQEQRSPGRVLLGIDKGRSGADVSLRRPPEQRRNADTLQNSSRDSPVKAAAHPGKSFNERMAERRETEKEKLQTKVRSETLRQQRSTGFGVQKEEVDAFRKKAEAIKATESRAGSMRQTTTFSRDQIMNAVSNPGKAVRTYDQEDRGVPRAGGTIGRYNSTAQRPISRGREEPKSSFLRSKSVLDKTHDRRTPEDDTAELSRARPDESDTSLFEPISSTPLQRRILPHTFLERTLSGKTHVPLTSMLRHVKAPDWELPDEVAPPDADFVVFAIIGSKSAPLDHRGADTRSREDPTTQTSAAAAAEATINDQKKYMVFTLVSPCLRWSVDMYLFGTGYTRWRMLTPGTVIAILNPGVMPPPPGKADTNRWSMKLGSSDDTILEIGLSRDMGWCKTVKKNGQQCGAWVDKGKHEFCEFHIEMNVERIRSNRMDAQGGSGFNRTDGTKGRGRGGWAGGKKQKEDDANSLRYDYSSQSQYYISAGMGAGTRGDGFGFGRSAASMLDFEEQRGGSKEKTRRILAQREKERELARELGKSGRGAGAEYMSKHGAGETDLKSTLSRQRTGDGEENRRPKDAKELGLHGGKAADIQLSPLKRKQSRLGDAEGLRKKTRFITSKGIRVAGRESLPNGGVGETRRDDSDDDLEIV